MANSAAATGAVAADDDSGGLAAPGHLAALCQCAVLAAVGERGARIVSALGGIMGRETGVDFASTVARKSSSVQAKYLSAFRGSASSLSIISSNSRDGRGSLELSDLVLVLVSGMLSDTACCQMSALICSVAPSSASVSSNTMPGEVLKFWSDTRMYRVCTACADVHMPVFE